METRMRRFWAVWDILAPRSCQLGLGGEVFKRLGFRVFMAYSIYTARACWSYRLELEQWIAS